MYQIGEFSIITRLSVKTLRYYHEQALLPPDYIDEDSGYRYYNERSVERAMAITALRELEFSLSDIKEIFANCQDDADLTALLEG